MLRRVFCPGLNCRTFDLCLIVTSSGISGRCGITGGSTIGGVSVVSESMVQGKWSSPWVQWGGVIEQTFMVSIEGQIFSIGMVRSIIATVEVMGTEKSVVAIAVGVIAEVVSGIGEVMSVAIARVMEEGGIMTEAVVAIEGAQLGVIGIAGQNRHDQRAENEQGGLHDDSC